MSAIDAFPGQVFPAKISAIDAVVDSTTRSIQVRATLPNDNLVLRPGMFATVKVNVGAPQELVTLPQTATHLQSVWQHRVHGEEGYRAG